MDRETGMKILPVAVRLKECAKKTGLIFLAGVTSFVLYLILLMILTSLVDYFRSQQEFELQLFFDSFLRPIALVWFGGWAWISGMLLSNDKSKVWGRRAIYLYPIAAIAPYVLSFLLPRD